MDPKHARARAWTQSFGLRSSVFASALLLACGQKQSEVPRVSPSGVLELPNTAEGTRQPMRVVHSGPEGQALSRPTVQILFSQPLRELDAEVPLPSGLSISPDPGGHFEWLGTRAIVYVPNEGELPLATRFRVRVPAGITSVFGDKTPEAHEFEFMTPLPEVIGSSPRSYNVGEGRQQEIRLTFSQAVDPAHIAESFRVTAQGEPQGVRALAGSSDHEVVFRPVTPWPLDARVEYALLPGYRGKTGELVATQSYSESFKVYGPLIARVECDRDDFDRCRPGSYMSVSLSNPVPALRFSEGLSAGDYRLNVDRSFGPEDRTYSLYMSPKLEPGQSFEVKLAPGLRDVYGQPLSFFAHSKVVVGDYRPSVQIGFSGNSIPAREKSIAVLSQNAPYTLFYAPLDEKAVAELDAGRNRLSLLEKNPRVIKKTIPLRTKNKAQSEVIDLEALLSASGGRGAFAVGVRYKDERGNVRESVRWAQRTGLGVTAKLGRGQSQVWVTDLLSGAPVQGATISVVGGPQAVAHTDPRGLASLPPGTWVSSASQREAARWVRVEHGADVVLRSSHETVEGYFLPVATDFEGERHDRVFLFPEREILRPGDAFWVKGYVRQTGAEVSSPRAGAPFKVVLMSPEGTEIQALDVRTNEFGALSTRLQIPLSAPLGYFQVALREGKKLLGQAGVQVAEYVPAEFKTSVTPKAHELTRGDTGKVEVSASYLYGAPMADARTHVTVFRYPAFYSPPGRDALVTSDSDYQSLSDRIYQSPYMTDLDVSLSEEGRYEIELPLKLENMVGPERIETEAEVVDLSNRAQSARGAFLVHPASYYLGLERPESYFVDSGASVTPKLLALTPKGEVVSGRNAELTLYRIRYAEVTRKGSDGEPYSITERVQEKVGSCAVRTETAARGCALTTKYPGLHVVRATSSDERGRPVAASYSFYAVGSGAAGFAHSSHSQEVELQLDRETYRVGDTAKVLIKSPFKKARAWVTLEREDAMESFIVDASGSTPTFSFQVKDRLRPNAHVGVVLIEDRAQAPYTAKLLGDSYRIGYVELRVDPEEQRLAVDVRPDRESYRPADQVTLDFTVKDAKNRPVAAEVSVFVVDEGVLLLSGQGLPDPLSVFTAPEPLRVETLEGRRWLAHLFGFDPADYSAKGDPGGGGEDGRSNFLTTAYFNPSLVTDSSGRARATFTLPDNVGQFRVTAIAVSRADQYGSGRGDLIVNQELMVRPQLPRFVRAGDEFSASAQISSLAKDALDVKVSLETKGAEKQAGGSKMARVLAGKTARVDFPVIAGSVGELAFDFQGQAQALKDRVRLTRPIRAPSVFEAVAAYGNTEDAAAERLGSLSQVRPDVGELTVTLSSTALAGLRSSYEALIDYPYFCTEQLTSQILPLLALQDLETRLDLPAPKDRKTRIGKAVQQILKREHGNGSFGMWSDSTRSDPFVSAYAYLGLDLAKKKGYFVPEGVLDRAERYLARVANGKDSVSLSESVFANFVLTRTGRGDAARLNSLYEKRETMSISERALLLWAAAQAGQKALVSPLEKAVEAALVPRGARTELSLGPGAFEASPFASPTRTQAFVLGALVAANPKHPLVPGLVLSLLDQRKNGAFGSTQESAFALLSLADFQRKSEPEPARFDARLFVGEREVFRRAFHVGTSQSVTATFPMKDLLAGSDLVFAKSGQGNLYYETRLRYARADLPRSPSEAGFAVEKKMRPISRQELLSPGSLRSEGRSSLTTFQEGDLVLVEVIVLAPDERRFVVIDDPLPAGFEAIDFSLATSSSHLAERGLWQDGFSSAWYRRELRDEQVLHFVDEMPAGLYRYAYLARATSSGSFVVPPTSAKEMYQEEVFGRTAATKVKIAPAEAR